ncbi:MAG: ElyC/SanA/YdcF family protein [Candidatus Colwellbacteria bacterium]
MIEEVTRILAFCFTPKGEAVLRDVDVWVLYTGDGWQLPAALVEKWLSLFSGQKKKMPIFVTGPDNLLLANEEEKDTDAEDFAIWMHTQGIPRECIFADSRPETKHTHGQAISLIDRAAAAGWKSVALFTSWYHAPRAFLTTVVRIPEDMELLVIPEPTHRLSFAQDNPELEGAPSAWELLNRDMLSRLRKYQEAGYCATFEDADAYLRRYGFGENALGIPTSLYDERWALEM